ncbi:hypothetical protein EDB19DRAFT_1917226 [Suillus lakei]|nr:hypothetical protein EDB19DRAFT_1917226 [Suillus lakei]
MAPATRYRSSTSLPALQAHALHARSTLKNAAKKRKRTLEEEENAEAAHQEMEWQSSQAQNSALDRDELDEILDDPDTDEGDEDEDIDHLVLGHTNTQKRGRHTFARSSTRLKLTSEARRSVKRLKSNVGRPTFEASSPAILTSKLPWACLSTSRSHPAPTLPCSAAAVTPIPSTPPHSSHQHSTKPRMSDQTPTSRAVVKTANSIFRVYVATDNGFPTEDEIAAHSRASFKRACKELKRTEILGRFEEDPAYAAIQAKIVAACPSQIRSELKSKVQSAVVGHYELHSLSKSKLEARIAGLLHEHAYVFRNPDKREGFFRHPISTDIFGAQWLRKRGEAAGEYAAAFNPVPLPTLALIATAIECALRDYVKGYKEIRRGVNEFSGGSYRGSYDSHLCTLRRQEQKHPQLILKLQQEIFQVAYDSIGDFEELEETTDYLGEFDLEADMML